MKKILIPSDFKDSSLDLVERLLEKHPAIKISVLFFHVIRFSGSVTDLLLLSKRSRENSLIDKAFTDRCNFLEKKYRLNNLKLESQFFYGSTVARFRDYLRANQVDLIWYNRDYFYDQLSKNSLDPGSLIQKSGYPTFTLQTFEDILNRHAFSNTAMIGEGVR